VSKARCAEYESPEAVWRDFGCSQFYLCSITENSDRETFKNFASLVRAKKIPAKRIKAAAALGLDGFNLNNSIHWPTLEKSLTEHAAEIDAHLIEQKGSSMEDLRCEEKELGNHVGIKARLAA